MHRLHQARLVLAVALCSALSASFGLLLADAQQCNLMPPNDRLARKNPGLYLNGTVDARVCRYECSRIRPPPRFASVANDFCLCADSLNVSSASPAASCSLACPITSSSKCGSPSSQVYFSTFNVTVPVSGVQFRMSPQINDGNANESVSWIYGESNCNCTMSFSFSDSIQQFTNSPNGVSGKLYLHNTGPTAQTVLVTDSENNNDASSGRVNIVHKLQLVDVTVDSYQAYNRRFDVLMTIRKGSNVTMSANFGNGQSVTVAYVPRELQLLTYSPGHLTLKA